MTMTSPSYDSQQDLLLALLLFLTAISIYALMDFLATISLNISANLIFFSVLALFGGILLRERARWQQAIYILLVVLVIVSFQFVDWNSRKPFLRDLNSIKIGMSYQEVEEIMDDYIFSSGIRTSPLPNYAVPSEIDETDVVSYRHTEEGWGDADIGIVTFSNGQVIEIRFLPD